MAAMPASNRFTATRLTPRERDVLRWIADHPRCTTNEIATALGVTRGRVFQILYRLENNTFITRGPASP